MIEQQPHSPSHGSQLLSVNAYLKGILLDWKTLK